MASRPCVLRDYRPEDLDVLVAIDELCFAEPFRFTRATMRRYAEASNAQTSVALVNGVIAGFVVLHSETLHSVKFAYVATLDVHPSHRRLGIACALMSRAENAARKACCDSIFLHVYSGNAGATAFYKSCGFGKIGLERNYYAPEVDAFLLHKPLTRTLDEAACTPLG